MQPEEDVESATSVPKAADDDDDDEEDESNEEEEDAIAAGEFVERVLDESHFPTMQETLERLENEQYVTEDVEPDVKF